MASGMTPAKKFALRAAMVSGSTVALIVGAQTLITVDAKSGRASQPAANSDTTSTDTQRPQQSNEFANSGVRVIRGPNGSILLFSREHEESEHDDDYFGQEQQFQSDQQSQLFNSQQSFSFPRTHSSR